MKDILSNQDNYKEWQKVNKNKRQHPHKENNISITVKCEWALFVSTTDLNNIVEDIIWIIQIINNLYAKGNMSLKNKSQVNSNRFTYPMTYIIFSFLIFNSFQSDHIWWYEPVLVFYMTRKHIPIKESIANWFEILGCNI